MIGIKHRDGVSTRSIFAHPYDLAIDSKDNIYVADKLNSRIRKISPSLNVTTFIGNGHLGYKDGMLLSSMSPPSELFPELILKDFGFFAVDSVAIDRQKDIIYAASAFEDHTIRMITPNGNVTSYAGKDYRGNEDGLGTSASFEVIRSLEVDSKGNLFVADSITNTIRRISPDKEVVTFAGDGYIPGGWVDGKASQARFDQPFGVCVDKFDRLFVSDTTNNKIRQLSRKNPKNWRYSDIYGAGMQITKKLSQDYDEGIQKAVVSSDEDITQTDQRSTTGKEFIKAGNKVVYLGPLLEDQELVEVVEVNYNSEEGNVLIKHYDYPEDKLQEVHESYLGPAEDYEQNDQLAAPKDIDKIDSSSSQWHGVYPTPKPTTPKVISHQHLEWNPYENLDQDNLLVSKLGDRTTEVPKAANRFGSYRGKYFDAHGNEISMDFQVNAEQRVLDPMKVYTGGTKEYARVEAIGKEMKDPFHFEIPPQNTPYGVLHSTELEIDPDQFGDWVEEDAKKFAHRPIWDPEIMDNSDYKFNITGLQLPKLGRLARVYEDKDLTSQLMKKGMPDDIAPRSNFLKHFWNKANPPPDYITDCSAQGNHDDSNDDNVSGKDFPELSKIPEMLPY